MEQFSPRIVGRTLVFAHHNFIYKIDRITGKLLQSKNLLELGITTGSIALNANKQIFLYILPLSGQHKIKKGQCQLYALNFNTLSIEWKRTFKGPISFYQSPIFSKKTNSVISTILNGFVQSIDSKKGDTLWRYEMKVPNEIGQASINHKYLFFSHKPSQIICLNLKSGLLVWSSRFDKDYKRSRVSYISSSKNKIFFHNDDFIFAIDANNGKILWQSKELNEIISDISLDKSGLYVLARINYDELKLIRFSIKK